MRSLPRYCLAVVLFLTLPAGAAEVSHAGAERAVLRVGSTGDYAPFSFRPDGGEFVGFDIELAGRLAAHLGRRLELVPTRWSSLMADHAAQRFELALSGISVTPERQRQAQFSLSYLRDGKTPIAPCAQAARYQTLAQIDRPEVRVIVNPGGTNESFVRAHLPRATLLVHPDNRSIFERLATGAADLMITDAIEARLQQALRPGLCAVHPEAPFTVVDKAALLPADAAFKQRVDEWLRAELDSGRVAQRLQHWLAYAWTLEPLRQLLDQRLALMEDVARYKWNQRLPIEDLPREAQLIAGLARQAGERGVDAAWATAFFRAQIEAAKTLQRDYFARWEAAGAGPFAAVPDLTLELRPRLDALTPRLLQALADNQAMLRDSARRRTAARTLLPLQAAALSPRAAAQALEPFLAD